jgi:hypothetical protein
VRYADAAEVDVEAKRRLDAAIREARLRCEQLEKDARKLSEEEAALRKEGDLVKEKMVGFCRRSSFVCWSKPACFRK